MHQIESQTISQLEASLNANRLAVLRAADRGEFLRLDTLSVLGLGLSTPIWAIFRIGEKVPESISIQKGREIPHGKRFEVIGDDGETFGHIFEFPDHYYVTHSNSFFGVSKKEPNFNYTGVSHAFRFPLLGAFHNQFAIGLVSLIINNLIPDFTSAREIAMYRDMISKGIDEEDG